MEIPRILMADDEPDLLHAVKLYLEDEGFLVFTCQNGLEALDQVRERLPDLVVLDVMMPRPDGLETLQRLRETSPIPVIMLTIRGEEEDKIRGLSLGADDYVSKPFGQRELLGRIQAVIRRAKAPTMVPKLQVRVDNSLMVDMSRGEVFRRDERVALTPTEYRLLAHFVANPGRLLTNETILVRVWGPEYRQEDHYVRVYVGYLRQKIEDDPARPRYIQSERGLGYRFFDYRHTSVSD